MKKHILLVDSLEKLVIKKDSSLLLALTIQEMGHETYLIFSHDLYMADDWPYLYDCWKFEGKINQQTYYVDEFKLIRKEQVELSADFILHARQDPPFDANYLRSMWMLNHLESNDVRVINSPASIMKYNEKIKQK